MQVKELSDVFVASGIEMVDDATFTALFYGYEVRGKVREPVDPTIEFYFYGDVYIEDMQQAEDFQADFIEKFGRSKLRFTEKFISLLIDIGDLDAAQVKERLGMVGNFMISNGFGAIAMLPEEPDPEPEPEPEPEPAPAQRGGFFRQRQQQRQQAAVQQQQPAQQPAQQPQPQPVQQQAPPQPVYEEPKVPFEQYAVLPKLTEIFVNGVNQTSHNMFTTLHHGYNVVGKMLSPVKDDIEVIFYGQLMNNVTDEFEALKAEMNEKYGNVPMRMIGGSCDVILYLDGKDAAASKEMLGCISGFMMRNNIAAVNFPNTVGKTIKTFNADSFKDARPAGPRSLGGYAPSAQGTMPAQMGKTYPSGVQVQDGEDDGNSFAKNFLKKFSKKP